MDLATRSDIIRRSSYGMALWQTERAAQSHNHHHHHQFLFQALSPMSQSIPDCVTIGVISLKCIIVRLVPLAV